jgi:alkylation response protein AidB-like acyl-CoA dehydrogenase
VDFSLSEVQTMLADSVEKFIANDYDFDTRQKIAASDQGYSGTVWQTFADLGWTAVPFSEADGGFDGGPLESTSDTQKKKWLQPLIAGELQAALAFVEPQSRYDLANTETTATADGDGWVINGHKGVAFNGGRAGLLIIPARTSGESTCVDGITLFAVGGMADGVSKQSYQTVDAHQAAEIRLENVRVDSSAVVGVVDNGYPVLETVIDEATLAVCADAVGIMQVMTDKTVEYSKSRVQFGVPIGSFQALQHRMVDMLTACELSYSLLVWASMANADQTDDARKSISALKYQIGTAGQKVGQEAVQLHGGMGVSWDTDIAHYFKRLTAIGQMFGNADWHLDRLAS